MGEGWFINPNGRMEHRTCQEKDRDRVGRIAEESEAEAGDRRLGRQESK